MKIGNVILAIFLWIMIPVAFVIGVALGFLTFNPVMVIILGFGGPILLFILGLIVLLSGRETEPYKPPVQKKDDRRCPECGRVIPFDAKICPYCGKKFKTVSGSSEGDLRDMLEDIKEKGKN